MTTTTADPVAAAQQALQQAATALREIAEGPWWRFDESGLREVLGWAGLVRHRLHRMESEAMSQVLERGIAHQRGMRPVDYLTRAGSDRAPAQPAGHAATTVTLAEAIGQCSAAASDGDEPRPDEPQPDEHETARAAEESPRGDDRPPGAGDGAIASGEQTGDSSPQQASWLATVIAEFRGERLSATKAAAIVKFGEQAEPLANPEDMNHGAHLIMSKACDVVDGSSLVALDPLRDPGEAKNNRIRGFTDREVSVLIRRALRLLKPAEVLERDESRGQRGRSLHSLPWRSGMTEYRFVVEPEAAAIVDAAVSALSAPDPEDGTPDLRSAARRRADALLQIIQRGVSAPGKTPRTEKAQVMVTIGYDELCEQIRGAGVTMTGQVLSPETVRRIACDAAIIPAVLGSDGQIIEIGHLSRLFKIWQLWIMWLRDGGCSYPGCTIPPQWCHAHHIKHWINGGRTDVSNGALLCQRHHTHVHQRGLTATVTATGVTWHT